MNGDLMPLVDELHALRNENSALRLALAEQSVRIDEMLQHEPTMRHSLRYLTVAVEHVETIVHRDPAAMRSLLTKKLTYLMAGEVGRIAHRVEAVDKDTSYYRFAFISLWQPK